MAYQEHYVSLHAKIRVKVTKDIGGRQVSKIINCTVGRLIFNENIPQNLGYVDRRNSETAFDLEISFLVGRKQLSDIIERCIRIHGTTRTSEVLDDIKALGFKYSTKAAITVAVCDASIPPQKKDILAAADAKIATITEEYEYGYISSAEKSKKVIEIWNKATDDVTTALKANLDKYNPIFMMADSGARGSINQIRQLAGMRGLIANTSGTTIEIPIRANYREVLISSNTSFLPEVREKVLPILLSVLPTQVILHVVLLTFLRTLSSDTKIAVLLTVLKFTKSETATKLLKSSKNVLWEDTSLKTSAMKQATFSFLRQSL